MNLSRSASQWVLLGGLPLVLLACKSAPPAPPAPVVSHQVAGQNLAEDPVPPGFYRVKRGDTLIGIALDHGVNYKDIARWNQLDNANRIEVGQQLRIKPEDSPVEIRPLPPASRPPVVEKPLEERPLAPAKASKLVTEPKVNKQPYADDVYRRLMGLPVKGDEKLVVPPAASPAVVLPNWVWPTNGRVLAHFGDAGSKGIQISGASGDPVMAVADGKVVYVGNALRGYGNLVMVKHDDHYLTVYAHNRRLLVTEGQSVKQGHRIAEMGDSDTDRVKLHFEVRKNGKPVDPLALLPQR